MYRQLYIRVYIQVLLPLLSPSYFPSTHPPPLPPSQDEGIPPLNASLNITVRVDPEPPVFNQTFYTANVPEFTGEVSPQAKVVTYTLSCRSVCGSEQIVSNDQCHLRVDRGIRVTYKWQNQGINNSKEVWLPLCLDHCKSSFQRGRSSNQAQFL